MLPSKLWPSNKLPSQDSLSLTGLGVRKSLVAQSADEYECLSQDLSGRRCLLGALCKGPRQRPRPCKVSAMESSVAGPETAPALWHASNIRFIGLVEPEGAAVCKDGNMFAEGPLSMTCREEGGWGLQVSRILTTNGEGEACDSVM